MSNIYIQEPPTFGKVLMKTTVGDIDIELWSKECPKACRNFVQLCLEGYYNGLIFHRVVKGFVAQSGCPYGDGTGGESIFGEPFKDEFHSRLRYSRRGMIGMANSGKNDNGSQFFFTMAATPELQNKNTLFGKVTGNTIFNMLKLEECLVDHNERPLHPPRIIKTKILSNPFEDIIIRKGPKCNEKQLQKTQKEKGVKNFGLLSFGDEAEDDEELVMKFEKQKPSKSKSSHDVLDDPKLSKEHLKIISMPECSLLNSILDNPSESNIEIIREKLRGKITKDSNSKDSDSSEDEDHLKTIEEEKQKQMVEKKKAIQEEINSLKKQYKQDKKSKTQLLEKDNEKEIAVVVSNELIKDYIQEQKKYADVQKLQIPRNNSERETQTLMLLQKFRNKLGAIKSEDSEEVRFDKISNEQIYKEITSDHWLKHKLSFKDDVTPILAKDASTKNDDWYDAYDPRNTLNKRKRGDPTSSDFKDDFKKSK